jgi:tetratricopeptide (TPR) repeat protein
VIGMDYANTLAEHGDSADAAKIYQKLIQAHPDMWNAYFNFGYMCYQLGELDSAGLYLSQAAAGDPSNAGAVFYLGLTDFKLNRMHEAEMNLRRAIALAPSAPNYHFALGMVLKVTGNGSGAMAEFTKELAINPGHHAAAQQAAEIQRQIAGK